MDVYSVILEAKNDKIFSLDEIDKIFSLGNEQILFKIAAEKEDGQEGKFVSVILKNRNNFWENKHNETLKDFSKEFNKILKKEIKNPIKVKKSVFKLINKYANDGVGKLIDVSDSPNIVFFKLFMNEYNNKYAFTWKAFKETKRMFEKTHPVEGEDIYTLKSLLEKDPKILKIKDSTVFCKSQHSLSDSTLKKIKEKLG